MNACCFLTYDIPETSGIPNPSGFLRRIAVRINLSDWIIPEGNIPYPWLNYMHENGASVHVVKFDVSESKKLMQMCISALRSDIKARIAEAKRSMGRAENLLRPRKGQDRDDKRAAYAAYCRKSKTIITRLRQFMADMNVVTEQFGIPITAVDLPTATRSVFGIQATMRERARLYVKSTSDLAEKIGERHPVIATARRGRIPGVILADAMDDNGVDGSVLRNLFD